MDLGHLPLHKVARTQISINAQGVKFKSTDNQLNIVLPNIPDADFKWIKEDLDFVQDAGNSLQKRAERAYWISTCYEQGMFVSKNEQHRLTFLTLAFLLDSDTLCRLQESYVDDVLESIGNGTHTIPTWLQDVLTTYVVSEEGANPSSLDGHDITNALNKLTLSVSDSAKAVITRLLTTDPTTLFWPASLGRYNENNGTAIQWNAMPWDGLPAQDIAEVDFKKRLQDCEKSGYFTSYEIATTRFDLTTLFNNQERKHYDIEHNCKRDSYDPTQLGRELTSFISSQNAFAALEPRWPAHSKWKFVKLGNVFVSFDHGGHGKNGFHLFYKKANGQFLELTNYNSARNGQGICSSAYVPLDIYHAGVPTEVADAHRNWSYQICQKMPVNSNDIRNFDFQTYDLYESSDAVFWRDCNNKDRPTLKTMGKKEFVKFLNDHQVRTGWNGPLRPFDENHLRIDGMRLSNWNPHKCATALKSELGLTCQTLEQLPAALTFRDDVIRLIQQEKSIEEFMNDHNIKAEKDLSAEEVFARMTD